MRNDLMALTSALLVAGCAIQAPLPQPVAHQASLSVQATSADPVLPPSATPFGKTYSQWAGDWWRWALSIPVENNPLLDTTGKNAQIQQSDKNVFFLAGFAGSGSGDRTCKVPSRKALFFPIVNIEADNSPYPCDRKLPPTTFSGAELLSFIAPSIDAVDYLAAELDLQPISGLGDFRASNTDFSVTFHGNNVTQFFANDPVNCPKGEPQGTYTAACDGYWLMLKPLSPGTHTLHFVAKQGATTRQDVTYHLIVTP